MTTIRGRLDDIVHAEMCSQEDARVLEEIAKTLLAITPPIEMLDSLLDNVQDKLRQRDELIAAMPTTPETSKPRHSEVWYTWKQQAKVDGTDEVRLLTPWANPRMHEFPFNLLFKTPDAARKGLVEEGDPYAGWVLCKMTLEVVE